MEERTFGERLYAAYQVVEETQNTYGAQEWFRKRFRQSRAWDPHKATVHRWCSGKTKGVPQEAWELLRELEEDATGVLEEKLAKIKGEH